MNINEFIDRLSEEVKRDMPIRDIDRMLKSTSQRTREEVSKMIASQVKDVVSPYLESLSDNDLKRLSSAFELRKDNYKNTMRALYLDNGFGYTLTYFESQICDFCTSYKKEDKEHDISNIQEENLNMNQTEEQKPEKKGFFRNLFSKKEDKTL